MGTVTPRQVIESFFRLQNQKVAVMAQAVLCPHRPVTTELPCFHDPMCSWCWAFRPVWTALCTQLPAGLTERRVVGGLAPDSDEPLPHDLRRKLNGIWQATQECVPGTRFSFAFWEDCTPRRSTYNAFRAFFSSEPVGSDVQKQLGHETDLARSAPINGLPGLVVRTPLSLDPGVP